MEITIVRGDITKQQVDAVVNAARSSLLGGGGVDGAIHLAGGPTILAQCRELRASAHRDGLAVGQAAATTGGLLAASWVIHTVGPVYRADEDRSALLTSCYVESLAVADELGARTVAFPAISAGAYGWPMQDAARIAIAAAASAVTSVEQVRFVLLDDAAMAAFQRALGSAAERA
jgi:O-acetyl-ADP-ribose deacetylase (regulator of RNase III)